jgi:hypothetical protein
MAFFRFARSKRLEFLFAQGHLSRMSELIVIGTLAVLLLALASARDHIFKQVSRCHISTCHRNGACCASSQFG